MRSRNLANLSALYLLAVVLLARLKFGNRFILFFTFYPGTPIRVQRVFCSAKIEFTFSLLKPVVSPTCLLFCSHPRALIAFHMARNSLAPSYVSTFLRFMWPDLLHTQEHLHPRSEIISRSLPSNAIDQVMMIRRAVRKRSLLATSTEKRWDFE
jgi:hypothetical protein